MPLYDFECTVCGKIKDEFYKIDECPSKIKCECGKMMKKILAIGHGGIQVDTEPTWLAGARDGLQDTDAIRAKKVKPIETRREYKDFLKRNNIVPLG